jgi:hypothetical protein
VAKVERAKRLMESLYSKIQEGLELTCKINEFSLWCNGSLASGAKAMISFKVLANTPIAMSNWFNVSR